MQLQTIIRIFNTPGVIALVGDANTGKSNLIYHLINELKKDYEFKLFTYGLRNKIELAKEIFSINELEQIKDSIVFLDEFFTLFDLDDRKKKKQIENTIRLIFHNNNILMLVGLPDNFKKFISNKINIFFYKKVTLSDFINGSSIKRNIINYQGNERGSAVLNLSVDEVIVYHNRYNKYKIPYLERFDTKKDNKPIFVERKK